MDLHRAVGQLITGKVFGFDLDDATARLIADGTISGITLFKTNGRDLSQLATLVDSLHKQAGPDVRFLVSVDQEGGAVQRFEHIIAPLPSAMALSALDDSRRLDKLLSFHARHLALLGVNCNLVPVLDVNSNPLNPIIATRSYGDDPYRIADLGKSVARVYLRHGILPAGKHFPGHGDTAQDTHLEMVALTVDRDTLERRELAPFAACAGDLPAMLVAHVWVKALDKDCLPASLSANVVQGLVRQYLAYDGFLITDDMPGMKAIVDHWGLEDAAIMTVNAGIDHLLMCGTAEQVASVHSALMRAVEKGVISQDAIANAIRRREKAFSVISTVDDPLQKRIEMIDQTLAEARQMCRQVSAASVWLARGELPRISSQSPQWVLVVPDHSRYRMNLLTALTACGQDQSANNLDAQCTGEFSGQLAGPQELHERRYSINPGSEEIAAVATFAAGKNCIFLSYRTLLNSGQIQLANQLAEVVNPGSLLVATDVPYDLTVLTSWVNAIALFDPSDQAMDGLARLLTSPAKPEGRPPVRLDAG